MTRHQLEVSHAPSMRLLGCRDTQTTHLSCTLKMAAFSLLLQDIFHFSDLYGENCRNHFTTLMLWVCHFPPPGGSGAI